MNNATSSHHSGDHATLNANEQKMLKAELRLMDDAVTILTYSYEKCRNIEIKADMSMDDRDSFEAFCNRYARTSDIFIQKLIKLIEILDLERAGSVRDSVDRAEKLGIIDHAEVLMDIRNLGFKIAHGCLPELDRDIWYSVLDYTPKLLTSYQNFKTYSVQYLDTDQS